MRSEFTDKTTIFRNDYQGKVFYSATISKKDKDGEWQNNNHRDSVSEECRSER